MELLKCFLVMAILAVAIHIFELATGKWRLLAFFCLFPLTAAAQYYSTSMVLHRTADRENTLTIENAQCNLGNACGHPHCTCTIDIWRAQCGSAASCPNPNTQIDKFDHLTQTKANPTLSILPNKTRWNYLDHNDAITQGSVWIYVVSTTWVEAFQFSTTGPSVMPPLGSARAAAAKPRKPTSGPNNTIQ